MEPTDFPSIPGLDRAALLAAFSGAVAYLCTQDRMPIVRALAYVIGGTAAAYYVGPAVLEYAAQNGYALKVETRSAVVFVTGVCGIWLLNLIVALTATIKQKIVDRVSSWFGSQEGGPKP